MFRIFNSHPQLTHFTILLYSVWSIYYMYIVIIGLKLPSPPVFGFRGFSFSFILFWIKCPTWNHYNVIGSDERRHGRLPNWLAAYKWWPNMYLMRELAFGSWLIFYANWFWSGLCADSTVNDIDFFFFFFFVVKSIASDLLLFTSRTWITKVANGMWSQNDGNNTIKSKQNFGSQIENSAQVDPFVSQCTVLDWMELCLQFFGNIFHGKKSNDDRVDIVRKEGQEERGREVRCWRPKYL